MAEFGKRFIHMIFEFLLSPIKSVHPWGESPNKRLSWFGLTQGEYRLKVGAEYLLNYSEEFTNYNIENFPEYPFNTTFVDYYIVRLWEDILEILPAILEPVPKEIQHLVDYDYKTQLNWIEKINNYSSEKSDATDWLDNRWLDSAYLSPSARIWSDENNVVISWDNREVKIEGIPVWSATHGSYRINKDDFINEVRRFDKNLFAEMNERVEIICQDWKNSEIKIDFEHLKYEQKDRATWLESRLKSVRETDWKEVISAMKSINE